MTLKEQEVQENVRELDTDKSHITELKELIERKNKDIEDHKKLLSEKNTQLLEFKDLKPRINELEVEKSDMMANYQQQITSLNADLEKAQLFKTENEKKIEQISQLKEQLNDKDAQIASYEQYKKYFDVLVAKPLPSLTSFQSQIYRLLPDAMSATELYNYIVDLGFIALEKENFAKTLKALEKRGYYQRARDGDKIIWVKIGEDK